MVITAGASLLWLPALAAANDVDFSGTVAAGYDTSGNPEPEAEAQIELQTERVRGTRGEIQIEASHFDGDIFLEDAFIEHEVSERLELQLGVNKKRLGLEYEQGRSERLTPKRSEIYQFLEERALVGRQLNARVLTEPSRDVSLDFTAGTTGNRDANALVHLAREQGGLGVGYWGLVEVRRVDQGYLTVWANALSGWAITKRYRAVLEVLSGIDPIETDLERTLGGDRRVRFAGAKAELAVRLPLARGLALEPLAQSSFVVHDTAEAGWNTLELLGGVNLRYRGAILAVTAEYIRVTERAEPHERSLEGPNIHVQGRFHF